MESMPRGSMPWKACRGMCARGHVPVPMPRCGTQAMYERSLPVQQSHAQCMSRPGHPPCQMPAGSLMSAHCFTLKHAGAPSRGSRQQSPPPLAPHAGWQSAGRQCVTLGIMPPIWSTDRVRRHTGTGLPTVTSTGHKTGPTGPPKCDMALSTSMHEAVCVWNRMQNGSPAHPQCLGPRPAEPQCECRQSARCLPTCPARPDTGRRGARHCSVRYHLLERRQRERSSHLHYVPVRLPKA